jgi:hypothetical protein
MNWRNSLLNWSLEVKSLVLALRPSGNNGILGIPRHSRFKNSPRRKNSFIYELMHVAMRLLSFPASEASHERTTGIERDALGQIRFALSPAMLASVIQGKNIHIETAGMEDTEG